VEIRGGGSGGGEAVHRVRGEQFGVGAAVGGHPRGQRRDRGAVGTRLEPAHPRRDGGGGGVEREDQHVGQGTGGRGPAPAQDQAADRTSVSSPRRSRTTSGLVTSESTNPAPHSTATTSRSSALSRSRDSSWSARSAVEGPGPSGSCPPRSR